MQAPFRFIITLEGGDTMNGKTRYGIPLNLLQHDLAIFKMQHTEDLPLKDDQALLKLYYDTYKMSRLNVQKILYKNVQLVCLS